MHSTSLRSFSNIMTMITFTSLLLIFSSLLLPGSCCSWMGRYKQLNNQSLSLIQQMGGEISTEESPVHFPIRLYKSVKNAEPETKMIFIRECLRMILKLYTCSNCTSELWNADKTEHFATVIHRQVEELDKCVPTEKRNIKLRRYFRRLKNATLHHIGDRDAAWEVIRSETKYHLEQLHFLAIATQLPHSSGREHVTAYLHSTTEQN